MANRFLNSIKINDAYTFPASDGANGQAIITDGAGNLSFGDVAGGGSSSASVIYRDNFVGDGVETQFYLQRSLTTEDQSQVFLNGVYQEKDTYTVVGNLLTFSTAPASGYSVEVMSITGINTGPTTLYQDNFTGNGSSTTFTLANSVNDEIKTMVFLNGVYQFKGTYSVSGTSLIFDAAPANGVAIEVITIASASSENSAQKVLFYGKATGAISKGDAVMFAGAQGDHFLIAKATQAALSANHEYILGLANQNFAVNEYGYVVEFGRVDAIDTSMYTAGDILWFDSEGTTAGAITNIQPTPPNTKIQLAAVIRSHANEGVLFVRPTIYHELSELHDVSITNIADKDLLSWNNTLGVWENTKTLGNITTGNITTSGTVDGVDISSFKSSYDSHNHDDRYYTNVESDGRFLGISAKASDSNLLDGIDSSQFLRSDESDTMSGSLTANGVSSIGQEQAFTWQRTTGVASDVYSLNADSGSAYLYNNTTSDILMLWSEGGRVLINTTTDVGDPFNLQVNGRILQTGTEFLFSGDQDKSITVYNNRPLYLKTNDTTRVTILGGGNVGINETIPSAKLHITNLSGDADLILQSGTQTLRIDQNSIRTTTNSDLAIFTNNNVLNGVYVKSNGRVGVGTSEPSSKFVVSNGGVNGLEIDPQSSVTEILSYNRSTSAYTSMYIIGNEMRYYGNEHNWYATTGGSFLMRLKSNGLLGIGTSDPKAKLHIQEPSGNTATLFIKGGNSAVTAVGEINSKIDFGSNDTSVNNTDNIGGRIASVTEFSNGAFTGLAFYTFQQGRTPDLREAVRITNGGNVEIQYAGELRTYRSDNNRYGTFYTDNAAVNIAASVDPVSISSPEYIRLNTAGTERMRILSSGGLTFNGDTAAANALDDYEEGTWTPRIERLDSNPTVSYGYIEGTYTKIGNMVYIFFDISISSISGGSGTFVIQGLPYTVSSNQAGYSVTNWRDSGAFTAGGVGGQIRGFVNKNTTYIYPQIDNSGISGFGYQGTPDIGTGRLTGCVYYHV